MSYDIYLCDKTGKSVEVANHADGGTYVMGGTTDAWLNITYNYSPFFYDTIDPDQGICWIYGKTGKETLARLQEAISKLGTDRDSDYWKATPGNAGYALSILAEWARLNPGAIWNGS